MKKIKLTELTPVEQQLKNQAETFFGLKPGLGTTLERYQRHEFIIQQGGGTDKLLILLQGRGKIYQIQANGQQGIVHFLRPGDLIGELSLLEVETETKAVVALSQCLCLSLPLKIAREKLLSDSNFQLQLNRYLAEKLLNRTDHLSGGLNYPLLNRLAAFILATADQGVYQEKHGEVADYLGVSYRHLLYTLKELRELGLIKKVGRHDEIIAADKLVELAHGIKF